MAKKASAAKSRGGRSGAISSRGRVAMLPRKAKGNKHNGPPGLTDDAIRDWQGKLDRSYRKVTDAQDEVRSANGVYRSLLKEAGKQGFDKQAYIEARALDKEDHGHVQVRYANIGRYLRVRGSNLATQLSLFQDIDLPETDDDGEAAAVKGLKAGRSGLVNQDANPYRPGTEDHQAWDNNWRTGQSELAEETLRH